MLPLPCWRGWPQQWQYFSFLRQVRGPRVVTCLDSWRPRDRREWDFHPPKSRSTTTRDTAFLRLVLRASRRRLSATAALRPGWAFLDTDFLLPIRLATLRFFAMTCAPMRSCRPLESKDNTSLPNAVRPFRDPPKIAKKRIPDDGGSIRFPGRPGPQSQALSKRRRNASPINPLRRRKKSDTVRLRFHTATRKRKTPKAGRRQTL